MLCVLANHLPYPMNALPDSFNSHAKLFQKLENHIQRNVYKNTETTETINSLQSKDLSSLLTQSLLYNKCFLRKVDQNVNDDRLG